jgi:hypothetical protein
VKCGSFVLWILLVPVHVQAQAFKIEPAISFTNVFGSPRIIGDDGVPAREKRDREFELILSVDVPTSAPWVGFTVEAIFLPFDRESTPELEFETNFIWLRGAHTGGWAGAHFDVVDKFSPAGRPADRRAYTHKLNLELDVGVAIFNWLPSEGWLRRIEIEGSLDYVATGLPRAGDRVDDIEFVDDASPWSFSLVFVIPVAPLR